MTIAFVSRIIEFLTSSAVGHPSRVKRRKRPPAVQKLDVISRHE